MDVSIPEPYGKLVREKIMTGEYKTELDVITAGLDLLLTQQSPVSYMTLDELQTDLHRRFASIDQGEGVSLDFENIKARGRQRLNERTGQ